MDRVMQRYDPKGRLNGSVRGGAATGKTMGAVALRLEGATQRQSVARSVERCTKLKEDLHGIPWRHMQKTDEIDQVT